MVIMHAQLLQSCDLFPGQLASRSLQFLAAIRSLLLQGSESVSSVAYLFHSLNLPVYTHMQLKRTQPEAVHTGKAAGPSLTVCIA